MAEIILYEPDTVSAVVGICEVLPVSDAGSTIQAPLSEPFLPQESSPGRGASYFVVFYKLDYIMTITINSRPVEVSDAATIADVVASQQLPDRGIAVAVDNRMIRRDDWAATPLHPDAKIIIIKAACGG